MPTVAVNARPQVQREAGSKPIGKKTNVGTSSTIARVKAKLKLKEVVQMPNVAEALTKQVRDEIGSGVVEGYRIDRNSRVEWEQRNSEGLKLALQLKEEKTFPWVNCSNVKFPLITVAILQFLSRVSILTKGKYPVKCDVRGADPKGEGWKQAQRIAKHMSIQITEDDPNWMDDDEKCKMGAGLMGSAFKKTYFDPVESCMLSEYVPSQDFVVDYFTKNLDSCNRATHVLKYTKNDIVERERAGLYLKMQDTPPSPSTEVNVMEEAGDEIAGVHNTGADDTAELYTILEQHLWLDLDGDEYAEPYIAYVRADTKETLRVVARFFDEGDVIRRNDQKVRNLTEMKKKAASVEEAKQIQNRMDDLTLSPDNEILRITPVKFFTKYTFIPSPDGGFYDLGFSALLGPVNESVNTMINQLIDSGTMNTTAGGFLGRGVKMKGGQTSFNPFEWKPVDSTGDDLRKSIFPLPVREPSPVLLQLLQILVTYGEKISGATDIMTGISPGQNTPAETSRNTIEQGMKIFSGIFTRMHRGMCAELAKIMVINKLYLQQTPHWKALTEGDNAIIAPSDYTGAGFRVYPATDPTMVSETQRQANATMVLQASMQNPGYDRYLVNKEFLEAYSYPNIEMVLPDPKGDNAIQPPPNPKVELDKAKLQLDTQRFELEKQQFQQDQQSAMIELQQEAMLNQAKVMELQAKATALLAEAEGAETGHQIALINAQIGAAKAHMDGVFRALAVMQKGIDQRQHAAKEGIPHGQGADAAGKAAAGMAGVDTSPANSKNAQMAQGAPA